MISAILALVAWPLKIATQLIKGVLAFVAKYPVQCVVGAILLVALYASFVYGKGVGVTQEAKRLAPVITAQAEAISKYEKLEALRADRIKELEASTKVAGDEADKTIGQLKADIENNATKYAKELAAEKAKRASSPQAVTVVNPVTKDDVVVTLEGAEVICGRFSDAFATSVNEQIKASNRKGDGNNGPTKLEP